MAAADQVVDAPGVSDVADASSSLPNRRVSMDSKELSVVKLPPSCVKTQAQPPVKAAKQLEQLEMLPPSCVKTQAQPPVKAAKQLEMPADVGPSSTTQRLMHLMFADDSQDMPMSPPVSERLDLLPPAPTAPAAPSPPAVVQDCAHRSSETVAGTTTTDVDSETLPGIGEVAEVNCISRPELLLEAVAVEKTSAEVSPLQSVSFFDMLKDLD